MSDAVRLDGIFECAGDRFLAGDILEILRPPFPRQNQVRHKSLGSLKLKAADSKRTAQERRSAIIQVEGHEVRMPSADSQVPLWHRGEPLPLLPSGPDGVHGAALHRT